MGSTAKDGGREDERLELRLLTYVIGNPWSKYPKEYAWREVRYRLDDAVRCRSENIDSRMARTTLPILYKCIKPEILIFVIQDTILAQPIDGSYGDVVRAIESQLHKFLEQIDGNLYHEIKDKMRVIVAPGVGRFINTASANSGDVRFEINICGSLQEFYSYVFLRLASIMLEAVKAKVGSGGLNTLEVHLDLTHGINYMPTLTYKALIDIIPVIAAYIGGDERGREVKVNFITYNSEPVISGVSEEHEFTVHIVENLKVREGGNFGLIPSFEAPWGRLFKSNDRCIRENVGEVGKSIAEASDNIANNMGLNVELLSAYAGSLVNGLPLLLLKTIPEVELKDYVGNVVEAYYDMIKVNTSRQECRKARITVNISRKAQLTRTSIAIAKLLLARDLIRLRYEVKYDEEKGVSLEDLKRLVKIAFNWNERLRVVVSRDIYEVEEESKKLPRGEWIPWGGYESRVKQGEGGLSEKAGDCMDKFDDREQRNFIQHSGLHRCLVEVKVEEGRVTLRYSPERYGRFSKDIHFTASKGLVRV